MRDELSCVGGANFVLFDFVNEPRRRIAGLNKGSLDSIVNATGRDEAELALFEGDETTGK